MTGYTVELQQTGQYIFLWSHSSIHFMWKVCPHLIIQLLLTSKQIEQFIDGSRFYWSSFYWHDLMILVLLWGIEWDYARQSSTCLLLGQQDLQQVDIWWHMSPQLVDLQNSQQQKIINIMRGTPNIIPKLSPKARPTMRLCCFLHCWIFSRLNL